MRDVGGRAGLDHGRTESATTLQQTEVVAGIVRSSIRLLWTVLRVVRVFLLRWHLICRRDEGNDTLKGGGGGSHTFKHNRPNTGCFTSEFGGAY